MACAICDGENCQWGNLPRLLGPLSAGKIGVRRAAVSRPDTVKVLRRSAVTRRPWPWKYRIRFPSRSVRDRPDALVAYKTGKAPAVVAQKSPGSASNTTKSISRREFVGSIDAIQEMRSSSIWRKCFAREETPRGRARLAARAADSRPAQFTRALLRGERDAARPTI